jgi:glycosyltransferase involved in cell wall biosynthesis
MKVLLCHNFYQQPGGEDQSFAAEGRLLEERGHDVLRYTLHNDVIERMSGWEVACKSVWNPQSYAAVRQMIRTERPDVLHCTNSFPLVSPAACYAARAEGVPVVQSLRNYRLLCPNALFLRDGHICEDCMGRAFPWPGVVHACYRQDRAATAVVSGLIAAHRLLGTWLRFVDLYFTPTEFARRKFIEGGLPAERIAIKPNFVATDPGAGPGTGGYAIFVGRLSPEKGIDTLVAAWKQLRAPMTLKIVGDGALADHVATAGRLDPRIEWLGPRTPEEVLSLIGAAACLIVPSLWYETFGRTVVEAFARGTPVVASRLGALAELVEDGCTGLLCRSGDPADLAAKIERLLSDPEATSRMRHAARREYELKYTAEINYQILMAIYKRARSMRDGEVSDRVRPVTRDSEPDHARLRPDRLRDSRHRG